MFAPGQSRAAPCRAPGAPPMLSARIGSHRCAPWLLGRLGTLSGGAAAGRLHARAKRGAATSAPSGEDQAAEQGAGASQQPQDPAAAAPDLSVHAPVGEQWQPATLPHQWVAFSDLHVSHKTRATALAVLERVHEEAAKRDAGILFLGGCVGGMGGCCNWPVHLTCWVAACLQFEVRLHWAVPLVHSCLCTCWSPPPCRRLLAHARHPPSRATERGGATAGGMAPAHPHAARQPRPGGCKRPALLSSLCLCPDRQLSRACMCALPESEADAEAPASCCRASTTRWAPGVAACLFRRASKRFRQSFNSLLWPLLLLPWPSQPFPLFPTRTVAPISNCTAPGVAGRAGARADAAGGRQPSHPRL